MAIRHAQHPVVGLQFHPESVLSEQGYRLLDRFLHGAAARGDELPQRADAVRHFPTQKLANTRSSTSSGATTPIKSSSAPTAARR